MSTAKPVDPATNPEANGTDNGYEAGDAIHTDAVVSPDGPTAAPTPKTPLDVEKATKELATTDLTKIEAATARTWGGRALASYRLAERATTIAQRFDRFCDGDTFRQEAYEHASMADDGGASLLAMQAQINPLRTAVRQAIRVGQAPPSTPRREPPKQA